MSDIAAADGGEGLVVATSRPETMFGDCGCGGQSAG